RMKVEEWPEARAVHFVSRVNQRRERVGGMVSSPGPHTSSALPLEVLNGALVLRRRGPAPEGPKVAPLARAIGLA
ncbi:MAG TPA: hypothetical protein VJ260_08975, partial [Vicinamibacterales bacterium]|nr:hypothetical protein [Vicinamibacterales bacterium]